MLKCLLDLGPIGWTYFLEYIPPTDGPPTWEEVAGLLPMVRGEPAATADDALWAAVAAGDVLAGFDDEGEWRLRLPEHVADEVAEVLALAYEEAGYADAPARHGKESE